MDQELADAAAYMLEDVFVCSVHSPDGSTFLHEMALWSLSWIHDIMSEIRLP